MPVDRRMACNNSMKEKRGRIMKIGIFDSGVGGLFMLRSLVHALPSYDYIYAGDTKRVPYGGRSPQAVFEYTKEAVDFLFRKDCVLVVLMCNTASALALRRIQQEFLLQAYPERRVLGVLVPTAEVVRDMNLKRVGVLATQATVDSRAFSRELTKLTVGIRVFETAAPLLVPLIEYNEMRWALPILTSYLHSLMRQRVQGVILGCTHYPIVKRTIRKIVGSACCVVSQDEYIPKKLAEYMARHPEIEKNLSRGGKQTFFVTDTTPTIKKRSCEWFGKNITLHHINFSEQ